MRSARLPLTVTPIGRVCGIGIGMALIHVVDDDLGALDELRARLRVNRSHWKSGSKPVSSRNGWPSSSRARSSASRGGV